MPRCETDERSRNAVATNSVRAEASVLSEASDDALMGRAQSGDTRAFAELYDRHAARALRVAMSVCRDLQRSEDAVQEGFLAVWRSRMRFRPESGSFGSWSMTMVRNRAIDSYRNADRPQNKTAELDHRLSDRDSSQPEAEAIASSETQALGASIKLLPAAQAEVISLAFYGGLSYAEIATRLKLPAGTVKGRIRLGLEKLRKDLEPTTRTVES